MYGLDQIARINSTTEEYYLADGLGSTTALTDSTGLQYLRARYYDPAAGRLSRLLPPRTIAPR